MGNDKIIVKHALHTIDLGSMSGALYGPKSTTMIKQGDIPAYYCVWPPKACDYLIMN